MSQVDKFDFWNVKPNENPQERIKQLEMLLNTVKIQREHFKILADKRRAFELALETLLSDVVWTRWGPAADNYARMRKLDDFARKCEEIFTALLERGQ